ncbi:MAG: anhydro-N-acetylmuramic acid kinase [Ignavibacteriaceae bacterium]|nr:anhydro-N-acetylmuramic acid kinase [Ignavibacteriaceae bacterium]
MNIKDFVRLSRKSSKNVIGLMSGTSVDGVDVVLVKLIGNRINTKIKQMGFHTYPFPKKMREMILRNAEKNGGNVTEICKLNFLIARVYIDAIKKLCRKLNFPINKVDLIVSHGQTIHHLPTKEKLFGYDASSTLQIGDPSVIAKLTGVLTVGDFRVGDVALGGQGAPLIPYFDYIIFHSSKKNRALLNIGGISNFTILNKKGKVNDVVAFDTGPGNMLIDYLTKQYFNKDYDKDGRIAIRGKLSLELFDFLKDSDDFIEQKPPKSTGREYYGKDFLAKIVNKFIMLPNEDVIRTATMFTAYAVYRNYEKFIAKKTKIDELIISGGGARNPILVSDLKNYFGKSVEIKNIESLGISSDAKEAICFAVLANETISGNETNISRVTGAGCKTILGKICPP